MSNKCHICGKMDAICLFCLDCLEKKYKETFEERIKIVIQLDKEKKLKNINKYNHYETKT
jgi:hypothetical protein